eukprot:3236315-Pyramimonas_sp.AAC.1
MSESETDDLRVGGVCSLSLSRVPCGLSNNKKPIFRIWGTTATPATLAEPGEQRPPPVHSLWCQEAATPATLSEPG